MQKGILGSGENKIKVFTVYSKIDATILAIFHSPVLGRLQMKFEQH